MFWCSVVTSGSGHRQRTLACPCSEPRGAFCVQPQTDDWTKNHVTSFKVPRHLPQPTANKSSRTQNQTHWHTLLNNTLLILHMWNKWAFLHAFLVTHCIGCSFLFTVYQTPINTADDMVDVSEEIVLPLQNRSRRCTAGHCASWELTQQMTWSQLQPPWCTRSGWRALGILNQQPSTNDDADGTDGQRGEHSIGRPQMAASVCEGPPDAHMLPGLF